MQSASPVLRAQDLVKAFKGRTAVDHLELVLNAGDRVGLLGPNGATASLDPDIAGRVRSSLLDLHRRHNTTLLVTSRNMREVEALCERVVLMSSGRIVADGSPAAIATQFDADDLESAFLKVAADLRGPR